MTMINPDRARCRRDPCLEMFPLVAETGAAEDLHLLPRCRRIPRYYGVAALYAKESLC